MAIISLHAAYQSEGERIDAYLSRPDGLGPYPALLVIHEWWGLQEHIRDVCRRLAREGYVALAPDLYDGKVVSEWEEAARMKASLDLNRAVAKILGALPYLQGLPFVAKDRIGILGFCMGAGLALLALCRSIGFKAGVIYYHSIYPSDEELDHLNVPLLLHYGTSDRSTPRSEVDRLRAILERKGLSHQIYFYEGAGHAFFNDTNPQTYNKEAAEASWPRTLRFLHEYL